ncbi:unnamed protein product [Parnassius apollo]|uniref:(apollo) hypothetical protein n=1 Tax=Parnassius apollo TaxID=110799 RepID=A0A8S3WKU3_PARAO|nr:unnamed protein product [Parnassius apollo]
MLRTVILKMSSLEMMVVMMSTILRAWMSHQMTKKRLLIGGILPLSQSHSPSEESQPSESTATSTVGWTTTWSQDIEVAGKGHAEKVVMQLMEKHLQNGHSLYMDNYYNSFHLAKRLLENRTYCTGTLR